MGAFLGMQNCSQVSARVKTRIYLRLILQVLACRTGRMAADRVSGAAVFVMMAESFVPTGAHFKSS